MKGAGSSEASEKGTARERRGIGLPPNGRPAILEAEQAHLRK